MGKTKFGYKVFFFSSVIIYFFIHIITLHDGHHWGGDFAQYIIHARNILEGKAYTSGIYASPASGYPIGYPLLIAPVLKNFGQNFLLMKSINIFFWLAFVLALFPISRYYLGHRMALLSSVYLLSSPYFFLFKQSIGSDIPFLFFNTCSLLLFSKYTQAREHPRWPSNTTLLISGAFLMGLALLMRTAGIALFLTVIFYFFIIKRDLKGGLFVLIAGAVTLGIMELSSHSLGRYLTAKSVKPPMDMVFSILGNAPYSLTKILEFFFFAGNEAFRNFVFVVSKTAPVILFCAFFLALYRIKRKQFSILECFSLLYLLQVMAWPYKEGIRLFLPVAGFLMLFVIQGLQFLGSYLQKFNHKFSINGFLRIVLIAGIIGNSYCIYKIFDYNNDVLHKRHNQQLFAWVRTHIAANETYLFFKPRTLALLTGRTGYMTPQHPAKESDLYQSIYDREIEFVILHKGVDREWIQKFRDDAFGRQVWENDAYKVFSVTKSGGEIAR